MTELDLADINPLNWERARARARAVQAYIDLPKKSGVERDKFAADLKISPNLFSRLVAAWRAGKGMDGLMVGGKQGARRTTRLPARSTAILRSAITLYGASGTLKEIKKAVLAQCAVEGAPAPCKSTIHDYRMHAHRDQQAANVEPIIVVGELLVTLPCLAANGAIVRPKLLVAVEVASRHILGFRVMPHTRYPDLTEFISDVRRRDRSLEIIIDDTLRSAVAAAGAGLMKLSFESRGSVRRRLCRTFGSDLNGLQLIYQQSTAASPEQMLARKNGRAVSFNVAVEALELAIRQHNEKWPAVENDLQAAA